MHAAPRGRGWCSAATRRLARRIASKSAVRTEKPVTKSAPRLGLPRFLATKAGLATGFATDRVQRSLFVPIIARPSPAWPDLGCIMIRVSTHLRPMHTAICRAVTRGGNDRLGAYDRRAVGVYSRRETVRSAPVGPARIHSPTSGEGFFNRRALPLDKFEKQSIQIVLFWQKIVFPEVNERAWEYKGFIYWYPSRKTPQEE